MYKFRILFLFVAMAFVAVMMSPAFAAGFEEPFTKDCATPPLMTQPMKSLDRGAAPKTDMTTKLPPALPAGTTVPDINADPFNWPSYTCKADPMMVQPLKTLDRGAAPKNDFTTKFPANQGTHWSGWWMTVEDGSFSNPIPSKQWYDPMR